MPKKHIVIALLCLSSVILLPTVLTPVLAEIGKSFPETSTTAVQMVYTTVSLVSLPTMLLVGSRTARFSKKALSSLGLCLIAVDGLMPLVLNSAFWMLYAASTVIDPGIVTANVLGSSLIADHFKGIEKGRIMGYQPAAQSIVGDACWMRSCHPAEGRSPRRHCGDHSRAEEASRRDDRHPRPCGDRGHDGQFRDDDALCPSDDERLRRQLRAQHH